MCVKQSKVREKQKLFALRRGCKLQTLRLGLVCLNTFYCLVTLYSREGYTIRIVFFHKLSPQHVLQHVYMRFEMIVNFS